MDNTHLGSLVKNSDFGTIIRCEKTYTANMTVSINGYVLGPLAFIAVVLGFTATAPTGEALAKLSIPPSADTILNGVVKSETGVSSGNYIKIDTNGYVYQTATSFCKEVIICGMYPIK